MFHLHSFHWTVWQSLGLLVLRLVVGTAFILHGLPKIQNPMHWMGDKVPPVFQVASAIAEFGGGIALIIGFLTPIAAAALVINMIVALTLVHFPQHQPFVGKGGAPNFELPLVYLAIMIGLIATGPGRFSLDALLWGSHNVVIERSATWTQSNAA
jgi:putative oxidoreductase